MQKQIERVIYDPRRQYYIPVNPDTVRIGPPSHEAAVHIRLNGKTVRLYIPTWAYNAENHTIPTQAVGEENGSVIFYFPATQLGTRRCLIPKDEVDAWLKQEDRFVEPDHTVLNHW